MLMPPATSQGIPGAGHCAGSEWAVDPGASSRGRGIEVRNWGNALKSGTTVKSRFQLNSLYLGVTGRLEDPATRLQGALTLLLQGTEGRFRMQSAATTHQEKFGDLTWGLGLAGEWRPLDFFLAGLSLKGTINFGDTANTYEADLRGYVGAEWKYFRFEGGYRYMPYQEGHASSNSMRFDLYGPYVSLSIIFRI
jgi:hypothetical protein